MCMQWMVGWISINTPFCASCLYVMHCRLLSAGCLLALMKFTVYRSQCVWHFGLPLCVGEGQDGQEWRFQPSRFFMKRIEVEIPGFFLLSTIWRFEGNFAENLRRSAYLKIYFEPLLYSKMLWSDLICSALLLFHFLLHRLNRNQF